MKKIAILILSIFTVTIVSTKAQFIQNTSRSLFSDVKAFKVGDAVTILIMEETQADNTAITKDSRSTSIGGEIDAGVNNSKLRGNADLSTSNSFSGSGQTTRKENIRS
ncbi:MAG: flagellar basal body L-ring protein FlgH, partial [Candidatus Kapaibacteriota bacterium]